MDYFANFAEGAGQEALGFTEAQIMRVAFYVCLPPHDDITTTYALYMVKLMLSLLLSLCAVSGSAKSMRELWLSLPGGLLGYVDAKHCQEMLDMYELGIQGGSTNLLQGKSSIDTLTTDYLHVTLSGSVEMHVKRLAAAGGDSLVCVVKTWKGPKGESELMFFDNNWWPAPGTVCGVQGETITLSSFCDLDELWGLDNEEVAALTSMADFTLVSGQLDAASTDLVLVRQAPMVASDDQEKVDALLKPLVLHWDSQGFSRE